MLNYILFSLTHFANIKLMFDSSYIWLHLNYPPWLEKISKFTHLMWLKNTLKLSTMFGENQIILLHFFSLQCMHFDIQMKSINIILTLFLT